MNSRLRVQLQVTPEQYAKLLELQQAFAMVCNTLAPLVQSTACWNRVALHHMAYKGLRQQFPELGSQLVCNAIYSVSRACRLVYQHPQSSFNLQRLAGKGLPRLQFSPQSPVYFDRHTLSLKDGRISMLTLDGRMRFNVPLGEAEVTQFRNDKLREIVLVSEASLFVLYFSFGALAEEADNSTRASSDAATAAELPEYLLVLDAALPTPGWPLHGSETALSATTLSASNPPSTTSSAANSNRSTEIPAR